MHNLAYTILLSKMVRYSTFSDLIQEAYPENEISWKENEQKDFPPSALKWGSGGGRTMRIAWQWLSAHMVPGDAETLPANPSLLSCDLTTSSPYSLLSGLLATRRKFYVWTNLCISSHKSPVQSFGNWQANLQKPVPAPVIRQAAGGGQPLLLLSLCLVQQKFPNFQKSSLPTLL